MVILLRMGLYFFNSRRPVVFLRFLWWCISTFRHPAGFVFGAFKDYLHSIAFRFLCHSLENLIKEKQLWCLKVEVAFFLGFFKSGVKTDLVNCAESMSWHEKLDPHILLNPIEFLLVEVDVKFAFCATLWVGNVVATDGFLPEIWQTFDMAVVFLLNKKSLGEWGRHLISHIASVCIITVAFKDVPQTGCKIS